MECVRVAVNIRPLVTTELLEGSTDCITVIPGEPQIQIGSHLYTFDHVFGSTGQKSTQIYEECVAPLVDALLHGYNGTVLAYGQTGSGKTYTMGTNYNGEGHDGGIIPKVMETIFSRVEQSKDRAEFLIRVSYIEIFKEEVFDLLDPAKPAGIARVPIKIRVNCNGGITLAGVTEAEVKTKKEMASYLFRGSFARATASTNMNSQSSRSHAIFTIFLEQKKVASCPNEPALNEEDCALCAKLHLVDLAGSERAKGKEADGPRLREGIQINKGLLALSNVICALGDGRKQKGHVPYRDSNLTRLLQDSLGGNSKTVVIACVSSDKKNAEQTLNTLKYANFARNIQNKAVINRDAMVPEVQNMPNQIEELQAEVHFLRGEPGASCEETQNLKHEISLLEARNAELQKSLQEFQINYELGRQLPLDSQDSLGGNSKTVVIACVSPEKTNAEETLNTFNYANFAPNIQNKAAINRGAMAAVQNLPNQIEELQDKVNFLPGEPSASFEENRNLKHEIFLLEAKNKELQKSLQECEIDYEQARLDSQNIKHEISLLEAKNKELQTSLQECKINYERAKQLPLDSQVEEAKLIMNIESAHARKSSDKIDINSDQALVQAIEDELEVTVRVHQLLSEYERQLKERTRVAKELAELKKAVQISQGIDLSNCSQPNSRIFALENMLNTTSSTLHAIESQLSEAEERDRAFSGSRHWHQVRSLPEAKNIMSYLFNLVSSSRCLLWDKELVCKEKDYEIRDLKDMVVSLVRQLEVQKMTVPDQEKLQKLALKNQSKEKTVSSQETAPNGKSHVNDLQDKEGSRSSKVFSNMGNSEHIIDISDSEHSDMDAVDEVTCELDANDEVEVPSELDTNADDPEWVATVIKRHRKRNYDPEWVATVIQRHRKRNFRKSRAIKHLKNSSVISCLCSKASMCKRKCECQSSGGSCGSSCNCAPTKCTNRGEGSEPLVGSELGEEPSVTGDQDLASHGEMLLQSALTEKKVKSNDEALPKRKPLSDIGNSMVVPSMQKQKNSIVQLVYPTSQREIVDLSGDSDNSDVELEILLRELM